MSAPDSLAARIEHTLLAPTATSADIARAAGEAVSAGVFGLCVAPHWLTFVRGELGRAPVRLVTVLGFPTGAHRSDVKAFEGRRAVDDGAHEVDMVADLGAIAAREWARVTRDVRAVVRAVEPIPVKVILETSQFDAGRIASAARAAVDAGAAFVKTGTGFDGPATVGDVSLLRRVVGAGVGIKASGGVRTRADAERMVAAGADRIGSSRGPALLIPS